MPCPERELLSAYADGEITAAEDSAIERHLSECAECSKFAAEMRALDRLGRVSLRAIPVTQRHARRIAATHARRSVLARPAVLAAAAVVLFGLCAIAWLVASRPRAPQRPAEHVAGDEGTKGTGPRDVHTSVKPAETQRRQPRPDDAFEKWAAPYRALCIPLVPMESLANYQPPAAQPVLPAGSKTNGNS